MLSPLLLLLPDVKSSDPYVTVEDGQKQWHRTGVISKSLNPVWTLSTGSLFLIQTTLNEFFGSANRVEFIVKDYDSVGENDVLGSVLINKNDLLAGEGQRIEYPLTTTRYEGKNHVLVGNKKVSGIIVFCDDESLYVCTITSKVREIRIVNKLFGFFLIA